MADVLFVEGEEIPGGEPYEIFDPVETWKSKTLENYETRKLLVKIFDKGQPCYESPSITDIRNYCTKEIDSLWDAVKRFENPHNYYVDLSPKLWKIKDDILRSYKNKDKRGNN